eukprot:s17_g31.t1
MAPKKKANNGKAEGQIGATLPGNVNDDYFTEFQKALDTIRAHKCFDNILGKGPVNSSVPEFNEEDMRKALTSKAASPAPYVASGNFFWVDFLFSTMRGVPFNRTNIQLMVDHQFTKPATFSSHIEIAVVDTKNIEPRGCWRSVTPEEKLHAMIWAIHRDIVDPNVNEKVIKEWVCMVLKATFIFRHIETEDQGEGMYYRCANIREEVVTEAATVTRTAYQQIYEIASFSDRMSEKHGERLSAKKIAKLFADHVTQSKAGGVLGKGEVRSERMVDDVLTVARRGLSVPEIESVLRRSDGRWGHESPFSSVAKICGLISKCRPKDLVWVFQFIEHSVLTEQVESATLSTRFVLGDNSKVGFVDVILLKLRILQHLTNVWLPGKGCSGEVLAVLHEKMMTPNQWRDNVCPHSGPTPTMTWKKEWGRSMDLFLQFIEARRTPEEVLEYQSVDERIQEICKAFDDEKNQQKASEGLGADNEDEAGGEKQDSNNDGNEAAKPKTNIDDEQKDASGNSSQDQYWRKLAERTVQSHCELVAEPDSEQKLKEILDKTALRESCGTPGSDYIAILMDQKQFGESVTAPHLRCASFNKKRVTKLLGAVLKSRNMAPADAEVELPLKDGDVLMFLDNGKMGVLKCVDACPRSQLSSPSVKPRSLRAKCVYVVWQRLNKTKV